jgi:hypothetical protein
VLPGNSLAILLMLALVPGWVYLRLRQRHTAISQASGLAQLLEVLAVGLGTTGIAVLVFVLLPHKWLPFTVDVDAWADQGTGYVRANPRMVLTTGAGVLFIACAGSWLLDRALRRQQSELYLGPGVWVYALRERPKSMLPYLGVMLQDGTLAEGLLHSCSLEASEVRDVALRAPIRITDPGQHTPRPVQVERLVLPERDIRYITVLHVPENEKAPNNGRRE